jgi:hypothetical protein
VNKILQKILAVILSLVIVVSTSGLNLYGHFCGCCQIYEVSVTAFDENCCDEKADHVCSTDNINDKPCCDRHEQSSNNEAHQCNIDGCCTLTHEFLKVVENFNRPSTILMKVNAPKAPAVVFTFEFDNNIQQGEPLRVINNSSPPPLFVGKEFVTFTHSFKIAPSFHISA